MTIPENYMAKIAPLYILIETGFANIIKSLIPTMQKTSRDGGGISIVKKY
jgi:hypothetical protein